MEKLIFNNLWLQIYQMTFYPRKKYKLIHAKISIKKSV